MSASRALGLARLPLLIALVIGLAVSISLSEITLTVLAVWLLLARRVGVLGPLRWPLLAPIAAFAIWTVVTALASTRPAESLFQCKHLLTLGALWVIVNALPDPPAARRFATWLLLAVTGAAALALVQVMACQDIDATTRATRATTLAGKFFRKCARARGFYSIYMTLAGVLAMVLTATLPRLARLRGDVRWVGPAWILNGTVLALTYVRGAWVGLAAGGITAVASLGRRGAVAIVALAMLSGALAVALPTVRHRAATTVDPSDDTARDRLAMMEVGLQLAGQHWLTGIGPGQLKHIYPQLAPPEALRRSTSHVHNSPLQIVLERGVIGLAAWLWIFVAFFCRAGAILVRLPAETDEDQLLVLGSLAAIVTFLVAGLFEYNFGDTEVLMIALALMALPFAVARERVSTESRASA